MYGASQSFHVKSVKDGNFRFHDLFGGVSFASRRGVGVILYYTYLDRFQYHRTRWQVQD